MNISINKTNVPFEFDSFSLGAARLHCSVSPLRNFATLVNNDSVLLSGLHMYISLDVHIYTNSNLGLLLCDALLMRRV